MFYSTIGKCWENSLLCSELTAAPLTTGRKQLEPLDQEATARKKQRTGEGSRRLLTLMRPKGPNRQHQHLLVLSDASPDAGPRPVDSPNVISGIVFQKLVYLWTDLHLHILQRFRRRFSFIQRRLHSSLSLTVCGPSDLCTRRH